MISLLNSAILFLSKKIMSCAFIGAFAAGFYTAYYNKKTNPFEILFAAGQGAIIGAFIDMMSHFGKKNQEILHIGEVKAFIVKDMHLNNALENIKQIQLPQETISQAITDAIDQTTQEGVSVAIVQELPSVTIVSN